MEHSIATAEDLQPVPIHPHFAFNALNQVQFFIQKDDKQNALKYLSCFSKLLRLYGVMVSREEVSLQQEWNIISLYLELEQMRYSEVLSYELTVLDNPNHKLPSLIIYQHLEIIVYELIVAGLPKVHLKVASETNGEYLSVHIEYGTPNVSRVPSDLQSMKQNLERRLYTLQEKRFGVRTTTDHTGVIIHIPLSMQDQIPNS